MPNNAKPLTSVRVQTGAKSPSSYLFDVAAALCHSSMRDTTYDPHEVRDGSTDDHSPINIVFSGGGWGGFFHIGVMRYLQENYSPTDLERRFAFTGESAGSGVALGCALGITWRDLLRIQRKAAADCRQCRFGIMGQGNRQTRESVFEFLAAIGVNPTVPVAAAEAAHTTDMSASSSVSSTPPVVPAAGSTTVVATMRALAGRSSLLGGYETEDTEEDEAEEDEAHEEERERENDAAGAAGAPASSSSSVSVAPAAPLFSTAGDRVVRAKLRNRFAVTCVGIDPWKPWDGTSARLLTDFDSCAEVLDAISATTNLPGLCNPLRPVSINERICFDGGLKAASCVPCLDDHRHIYVVCVGGIREGSCPQFILDKGHIIRPSEYVPLSTVITTPSDAVIDAMVEDGYASTARYFEATTGGGLRGEGAVGNVQAQAKSGDPHEVDERKKETPLQVPLPSSGALPLLPTTANDIMSDGIPAVPTMIATAAMALGTTVGSTVASMCALAGRGSLLGGYETEDTEDSETDEETEKEEGDEEKERHDTNTTSTVTARVSPSDRTSRQHRHRYNGSPRRRATAVVSGKRSWADSDEVVAALGGVLEEDQRGGSEQRRRSKRIRAGRVSE